MSFSDLIFKTFVEKISEVDEIASKLLIEDFVTRGTTLFDSNSIIPEKEKEIFYRVAFKNSDFDMMVFKEVSKHCTAGIKNMLIEESELYRKAIIDKKTDTKLAKNVLLKFIDIARESQNKKQFIKEQIVKNSVQLIEKMEKRKFHEERARIKRLARERNGVVFNADESVLIIPPKLIIEEKKLLISEMESDKEYLFSRKTDMFQKPSKSITEVGKESYSVHKESDARYVVRSKKNTNKRDLKNSTPSEHKKKNVTQESIKPGQTTTVIKKSDSVTINQRPLLPVESIMEAFSEEVPKGISTINNWFILPPLVELDMSKPSNFLCEEQKIDDELVGLKFDVREEVLLQRYLSAAKSKLKSERKMSRQTKTGDSFIDKFVPQYFQFDNDYALASDGTVI